MCDVCGDVVLFNDWVQMTLDDSHEMWFMSQECLCGVSLFSAFTVDTAERLRRGSR